MKNEEITKLTQKIQEKIGQENSALISEELATLISDTANVNSQMEKQSSEIETLKSDKEKLLDVNSKLFLQVSQGYDESLIEDKKAEEKKPFSFKSCFDEKGNFK